MQVTLEDWIGREAIPFSLDAPKVLDGILDRLMASLGEHVELLGFGETLHGGQEILQLRNTLFERLVRAHGFTAIAIESSFTRAREVNEYIGGRGQGDYDAVQDTGFAQGVGRLESNRDLVEWMRRYNGELAHPSQLRFYGFDIPTGSMGIAGPEPVLNFTLEYLASIDPASANEHRRRMDSLLGQLSGWENPAAWADPTKSVGLTEPATSLRIATEDLITELRTRRPELVAHSGQERYLEALQYALLTRQLLNFHAALARQTGEPYAGPRGIRDALMADNLLHILARERARGGKVLVFAHNGHLQRGKSVWPCCGQKFQGTEVYTWWPAGSQLNDVLGERYAVIGTAVGTSADNGIEAPEPGSLEARLTALPGPALFIPTQGGHGLSAAEIASLPTRSGSLKNPTYTALTAQSFTDFDWLAVLNSTHYSRGGPSLDAWDAPAEAKEN